MCTNKTRNPTRSKKKNPQEKAEKLSQREQERNKAEAGLSSARLTRQQAKQTRASRKGRGDGNMGLSPE